MKRVFILFVCIMAVAYASCVVADGIHETFAVTQTNAYVPMLTFNATGGMNLYLYDPGAKVLDTIKENDHMSWLLSMNQDQTLGVYSDGVEGDNPFSINVYNILTKETTTIATASTRWESAFLNNDGKILFVDNSDGAIKHMDTDGSNITLVAAPEAPYTFAIFWLSPDRKMIAAIEERRQCSDYYTCNYDRGVLIRADDGTRLSATPEFLGEWNFLSWKPDSSGFLYYYHTFNGSHETPKYALYDISNPWSPVITNFSGSDWKKDENICVFAGTGNMLSLMYRTLYNGQTGAVMLKNISSVPELGEAMIGLDNSGNIYFADSDGTNFRQFSECTYSLSPKSKTANSNGSSGSVRVTAAMKSCAWTASSNGGWIAIKSGSSGAGNGTVAYSVSANPGTAPRTATMTVAGQTFEITQSGAPCKITSISETRQSFGNAAGGDSFDVAAPEGCGWTAAADSKSPWIGITAGSSGTGNGTVSFSVTANDTKNRTGKITIATTSEPVSKKVFTVTQSK
jgi:hypothetical protein